ncbi:MAG: hypothetical protein ACI8PB_002909 [Desulforhopalus sp.]|jgi:hypothetical protein
MAFDPALVPDEQKIKLTLDSSVITSDQIDFPLLVKLDSANPLHVDLLTDLALLAGDDDFTGTDGDAPNPLLWTTGIPESYVVKIDDNSLYLSKPIGSGECSVDSTYSLPGDADVQVDYTLIDTSLSNEWRAGISILLESGNRLWVTRAYSSGSRYLVLAYNGTTYAATYLSTSDTSGKLRIIKSGSTITAQVWTGGSWTSIAHTLSDSSDISKVSCSLAGYSSVNPATTVKLDNFIINSGTVIGLPIRKKFSIEADGVQLPVEIESWGTSKATLHTKVPVYSSSTDTELVLSYDSTQDDNTNVGVTGDAIAQTVWDANFKAVYHMAQDPASGGACTLDSTANVYHGTPSGIPSGNLIDAPHGGKAILFQAGDWVDISVAGGAFSTFTIDVFARVDALDSTALSYLVDATAGRFIAAVDRLVGSTTAANVGFYDGAWVSGDPITADGSWYGLSWAFGASSGLIYADGVPSSALSYSPVDLDGTISISDDGGSNPFLGAIGELRISNIARAADWIKATNLSLTDQLITYSGVDIASTLLRAVLEQHWDLLSQLLRQILDQDYHLTNHVIAELVQVYGLRLLNVLLQLYGNSPQHRAKLAQHYGDCGLLRRILAQDYGDAARYRAMFDQEWNLPEGLRQSFVQRYAISEAAYRSLCDQAYDISEVELLRSQLDQLYVLAAGEAIVQRTDQSVVCNSAVHSSAYNIFIEQDEAMYYMVGELQLASELEYLQYVAYESEIVITISEEKYTFIVDGYPRKPRSPGNNSFIVPLASPTILLSSPHSKLDDDVVLMGMASVLVAALAAPYTVEWKLVDWFIPVGLLTGVGESAISIIKKIVVAAGGLVQTSPAGTLICRPEYPVSVNNWESATPDIELTDQDDFFQIDPSPSLRAGHNIFYLSNQSLAADSITLDVAKLSSSKAQIDVYMQQWDETVGFNMDHSGGPWVSVIAEGVTIEEVTEQVEIIGGSGQTTKPVMEYISHVYSEDDLGDVVVDEAGNVTTAILENSLLQLSYKKRYYRFLATDINIEDVQFFPEEVAV